MKSPFFSVSLHVVLALSFCLFLPFASAFAEQASSPEKSPEKPLTEEEKYYKKIYESLLPQLEEGLKKYQEYIKDKPEFEPTVKVLGKTYLKDNVDSKDMWENIQTVLEPLVERYAEEKGLTPSVDAVKARAAEKEMVSEKEVAQMQKRMDALYAQLQDESLSAERIREISDELNRVEKAKVQVEQVVRMIRENEHQMKLGMHMLAEKELKEDMTRKALMEQYKTDVLYETSGGEQPLAAYQAFLKEQQKAGHLEFLNPGFESMFWYYMDLKINPEKYQKKRG